EVAGWHFFVRAEDGIRGRNVTGVQTCALPIWPGIARLVLESEAPVVPVAIIGTDRLQPAGRLVPKLRRVGVVFGSPMDFSKYSGLPSDRFLLRSVTDEIMYEIMRLSGQEYVDTYASTVKTKLLTSAKPKKTDSAREDAKDSAKKPKDSAPQGEGDADR